jgi:PTH1 family peptidyl-tRNA hydrolase
MKFLIVGLGNLGPEYDATRHNIGFDVADVFVMKHEGTYKLDRHALVSECKWKGKKFVVIKPTTFMNLSGKAVKYWMDKEKITMENTLIIVDDLALPLGSLRLRPGGSDAGHNGLKSIDMILQTNQYPRLRFGIGNNFAKGKQIDFVLGKWTATEMPTIKDKVVKAVEMVESFAAQGIAKTMSLYND